MAALTREKIQDGIADTDNEKSVVKPYVMSHGTMECYSLKESRKFYEEFLGLECVRHARPAMVVRCGLKFHIVAVEVGAAVHPQNVLNHWGLDVGSKAEVDRVHKEATKNKDKYKIRQVLPVVDLRKRFGLPATPLGRTGKYLLVTLDDKIVALVVDAVSEFLRKPAGDIAPTPSLVPGQQVRWFSGVCHHDGRIFMMLDIDRILTTQEKVSLHDLAGASQS